MSILRKATVGLALAVSLTALAGTARADSLATFLGSVSMTFTSNGAGGGSIAFGSAVDIESAASGTDWIGSSLFMGPFTSIGALTPIFGGFQGSFTGPSGFSIVGPGAENLLSGNAALPLFFQAQNIGGSARFFVFAGNVTYNAGTDIINDFNANSPSPSNLLGSFSFTGTETAPLPISGGQLQSFQTNMSGTWATSTVVPEPGEWAAMGILASGLGALVVRARRRKA